MVTVAELKDSDGDRFVAQEGESHNVEGQFSDMDGANIALADLLTFTITLYNEHDNSIINSRNDQNALNANDHTVTTTGGFIVRLDPADAVIVTQTPATPENENQYHVIRLEWTYGDGTKTRTGIDHYRYGIQKLEETT